VLLTFWRRYQYTRHLQGLFVSRHISLSFCNGILPSHCCICVARFSLCPYDWNSCKKSFFKCLLQHECNTWVVW